MSTTPETGIAQHNPDPYNTHVPVIGTPNLEPKILGPLGTVPHYKIPNQNWPWDYGTN